MSRFNEDFRRALVGWIWLWHAAHEEPRATRKLEREESMLAYIVEIHADAVQESRDNDRWSDDGGRASSDGVQLIAEWSAEEIAKRRNAVRLLRMELADMRRTLRSVGVIPGSDCTEPA